MKNLPSVRESFRDWLTLPETKVFVEILTAKREDYLDAAGQLASQTFYKNERNESVTITYGKADGIATILRLMENCKEDELIIEEIDGEKVETYPTIDELLELTYGEKND